MGANEWAKRLDISDAASLETFRTKFNQLEESERDCPVPPKDGSRCAICRRKVMLDTRFKELCNGLCAVDGGKRKNTGKTNHAVNSAAKILNIYRTLPAAAGGSAPVVKSEASDSGIVGLSSINASETENVSNVEVLCRSQQCQRQCPDGGFCSRRCESGEADRVANVAKMLSAPTVDASTQQRAVSTRRKTASLASMMSTLAKPPPAPASPPGMVDNKADEEALRKFVVGVVGEKYWPVFEREEIEDLKTLRCCTAKDLQDIKIPLGPRLKLMSNLEGLGAA